MQQASQEVSSVKEESRSLSDEVKVELEPTAQPLPVDEAKIETHSVEAQISEIII